MLEIEFSYTNWEVTSERFPVWIDEFSKQTGIKVRLRPLSWSDAWVELFTMVSQGNGSDVSNIGSTWVSTLAKLDALRPFKPDEVAQMGGKDAFAPSFWQSTQLFGDQRIWSIPSLGSMYVIFYRKDLLQSIGLDPEKAFESPQVFQETLRVLKESKLEIPWLNPDFPHPYIDLLHTAASWVWSAGGKFISPSGDKVLFDQPQAIEGFANWLKTYRSVRDEHQFFGIEECRDLARTGRVAASLMLVNMAHAVFYSTHTNIKKENIGFANLTNVPWVGGGSYVIWDHVQSHPERLQAALELVKFLSTKQSNLRMMREADLLPVRMDALHESYPPNTPFHELVMQAATHGRSYYNVSHWRRVESQLCFELRAVLEHVRKNPAADSASALRARLEPLARRLNMVLEK
jgi:multiple sugar transport system substrate-binding protein